MTINSSVLVTVTYNHEFSLILPWVSLSSLVTHPSSLPSPRDDRKLITFSSTSFRLISCTLPLSLPLSISLILSFSRLFALVFHFRRCRQRLIAKTPPKMTNSLSFPLLVFPYPISYSLGIRGCFQQHRKTKRWYHRQPQSLPLRIYVMTSITQLDDYRLWRFTLQGSHSRKIIWYMVIVVSVGVLVSLLFVAGLMGSQTYASYLEGRRNKRRRKNQVKTEEDGKSSSPPLPSLFHDDHNHQHHHHSGKKSPSPPTFDVSSDEILQDLQAEGLVRSPTLVDYRHEDNYGFLPSHVPPASMIQAHLSGQQNHYNDLQSQDHHHHDHYSHPRSLSNPLTTPSLQGDDGESSDVTTTSSNLHSHHLCQHHREHPIVHYTTNPSCCLGESLTHCGQTHIQPSILTGGVGEHSSVSIHLANSADQPQLPPSLRFNHVYPVLRTSHPNLHQVLQTDLDSLESQPLDMNTSCSHAITSNINTSTVTTSSSSVLPSLSTLSPQRLFHTLGRSSHRNNHFLHHHHPHYGVSDKRLSTIDRNSFLLKENHPKVACTETTPPRGLMDNENHYYWQPDERWPDNTKQTKQTGRQLEMGKQNTKTHFLFVITWELPVHYLFIEFVEKNCRVHAKELEMRRKEAEDLESIILYRRLPPSRMRQRAIDILTMKQDEMLLIFSWRIEKDCDRETIPS